MNPESQENLQRILKLPLQELTENDKRFLHARRGYLTKSQLNDYKEVIDEIATLNAELENETGEEGDTPRSIKSQKVKQAKQPQDKDTRLDLDKADPKNNEESKEAKAARLRAELEALENEEEEEDGDNQNADVSTETSTEEDAECLDPDCTHENHE